MFQENHFKFGPHGNFAVLVGEMPPPKEANRQNSKLLIETTRCQAILQKHVVDHSPFNAYLNNPPHSIMPNYFGNADYFKIISKNAIIFQKDASKLNKAL